MRVSKEYRIKNEFGRYLSFINGLQFEWLEDGDNGFSPNTIEIARRICEEYGITNYQIVLE